MAAVMYGCEAAEKTSIPPTPNVATYVPATPTQKPATQASSAPTGTAAIPTATPFIYTVVANDTLIGIAARFNITFELLIAANPGIDPNFLSVGTVLTIPAGQGTANSVLPTPTPLSVITNIPVCYSTSAGGLWCFFLIENTLDTALENLAGVVTLTDKDGTLAATQQAAALLNRLPGGKALPLVVYFNTPVPDWEGVSGQVISAIAVPAGDERYLAVEATGVSISITESGRAARVAGKLQLGAGSPAAETLWVVAVAYDEAGFPVGIRRWESAAGADSGEEAEFTFGIYSVGGDIHRVELLVEARPAETGG